MGTPPGGLMAAPNQSEIMAEVLLMQQPPDDTGKVQLLLTLVDTTDIEGPNFARARVGKESQAFAFGLPAAVQVGATIRARAAFLGDARGGQFQLTNVEVVEPS